MSNKLARRIALLDADGKQFQWLSLREAQQAAASGKAFVSTFRGQVALRLKAVKIDSAPSPCSLTAADLSAIEQMASRKKIDQTRWERLYGYGLNPDPSLMATA